MARVAVATTTNRFWLTLSQRIDDECADDASEAYHVESHALREDVTASLQPTKQPLNVWRCLYLSWLSIQGSIQFAAVVPRVHTQRRHLNLGSLAVARLADGLDHAFQHPFQRDGS